MEKWMEQEVYKAKLLQLLNNERLHGLTHKAVEIILSYTTQDPNDFSRPYCRFVEGTLSDLASYFDDIKICFLNGQPEELCIPWGGWECFDTDRSGKGFLSYEKKKLAERQLWQTIMPELTKRLGLQTYDSFVHDESDPECRCEYDYYYLTKVDHEMLWEYYGYQEIYHGYHDDGENLTDSRIDTWKRLERKRNAGAE